MENGYISKLINRYFNGRYSDSVESKVQNWLLDDKHVEEKEESLFNLWENINDKPDAKVYNALNVVEQKLNLRKFSVRHNL